MKPPDNRSVNPIMHNYTVTAVTRTEELAALKHFWEANQWRANSDYEFFQLILSSRLNIISPCIFVVRRDSNIVALLVGRLEKNELRYRIGYFTFVRMITRQLIFIEGGHMGDSSEAVWCLLHSYADTYARMSNVDVVRFSQVRIPSTAYASARKSLSRIRVCHAHSPSEHWLLRLPKSMEVFLKERSRKHRYWIKRLSNVLDKEFGSEWEIRRYRSVNEAVEFGKHAEAVAKSTYHRTLGAGFILKAETERRLHLEASQSQLRGYVLFINNEPRAFWHCSLYKQILSLSSTGYQDVFRKYELGTVLLVKVFEDHCGDDEIVVDFGLGEAAYKQRFGSEHYIEVPLLLFSRTLRGFALRLGHAIFETTTASLRSLLDKLGLTQRLKTTLRRLMAKGQSATPAEVSQPTSKDQASFE